MTTALMRSAAALTPREGAEVHAFAFSPPIALAKTETGEHGGTIVRGIEVLKVGTFNGFDFTAGDLTLMAERFDALRDSGTFEPPFRVDHSWSVTSVVGYFVELYVETRTDPIDGEDKLHLVGDVEFTEPEALDFVKRGTYRNRSSEVMPYQTNGGVWYPLVFAGCAFVDIPAVEGLARIALSKDSRLSRPSRVILHTEGAPVADKKSTEQAEQASAVKGPDAEQQTDPANTVDPVEADGDVEQDGDEGEQPQAEQQTGEQPEPGADPTEGVIVIGEQPPAEAEQGEQPGHDDDEDEAKLRAAGFGHVVDERRQLRARLEADAAAQLARDADRDLATFRDRGVIPKGIESHARTLLGHGEAGVRDAARAVFEIARPSVQLGEGEDTRTRTVLAQPPTGTDDASDTASIIRLGMTAEQMGEAWESLTPEQRKDPAIRAELSAWYEHNDPSRRG